MQKKSGSDTETRAQARTLSKTAVRRALKRPTPELAPDEEKALRMLNGVSTPRTIVLERVGQEHPDAREKLLGLELELLRQWRERKGGARPDPRSQAKAAPAGRSAPAAKAPNARRDKIVQALKAKKPTR